MLNDNKDISAWSGDTISLTSTAPDDTAVTATLLVGTVGEPAIFTKQATYALVEEKLVADLTITDEENTIPVGEYKCMVRVDYEGGASVTFPNPNTCSDNQLPSFVIKARILDEA